VQADAFELLGEDPRRRGPSSQGDGVLMEDNMTVDNAVARFRSSIGDQTWDRLLTRLREVNRDIRTRGIRQADKRHDLLTGYSYDEFYDWDLYFENLYLSYYGVSRYCRNNLECFLDQQLPCGFVGRSLIHPRMRQHFKPFLAQIALLGSLQTGRFDWLLSKHYERLAKSIDYWFWYQDFDKNGLAVWDSADHSGMDNQDRRAGEHYSMTVEGVDLNCYLVRELQAMAAIARHLGYEGDAADFDRQAGELAGRINDIMWDEKDGFYYDRHERKGELVRVKSVAGFIPLWLGIVAKDRAERLVHDHLLNPDEFWIRYPVATWAKSEPDYAQVLSGLNCCNWLGTTWIPTNYMVFQGLRRQGFGEVASELAYMTFELCINEADTREYYDGERGIGQGLNPFWGWSSLAYLMPLEFELGYDPTDLSAESIQPIAVTHLGIEFPS
jgi:hypothetical protein